MRDFSNRFSPVRAWSGKQSGEKTVKVPKMIGFVVVMKSVNHHVTWSINLRTDRSDGDSKAYPIIVFVPERQAGNSKHNKYASKKSITCKDHLIDALAKGKRTFFLKILFWKSNNAITEVLASSYIKFYNIHLLPMVIESIKTDASPNKDYRTTSRCCRYL